MLPLAVTIAACGVSHGPTGPSSASLGMGPVVGGVLPVGIPAAGTWAGSAQYSQHRFITAERTIWSGIDGRVSLTLAEDGSASACLASRETGGHEVGRLESRSGQDERGEHDSAWLWGFRGSWTARDDGAHVLLDASRYNSCVEAPIPGSVSEPLELHCVLLGPGGVLPAEALACRLVRNGPGIEQIALDLGPSKRAGPWALRNTMPTERDPSESSGPWLLLAAGDGLHVTSEDRDNGGSPSLKLSLPAKPIVEEDWRPGAP